MKKIQVQAQVGRAENEVAELLVVVCCEGASDLSQEPAAINAQLGRACILAFGIAASIGAVGVCWMLVVVNRR